MISAAKKAITFLLITFAFSWGVTLLGVGAGLQNTPATAVLVLTLMMAGPAIAALICALAFEKGHRIDALGLRFLPNIWWLWALLIPVAIAAITVGVTGVASPHHITDPAPNYVAAITPHLPPALAEQVRATPLYLINLDLIVKVVIGALVNAVILTFTEELGWRGYLHYLWRPSGFWRASLATGAIWGLWHAPAIFFYGLNYPDHRAIGIPIFIAFCMLLAPVMTLIRDRGGATWAAGITHGTFNAVAGYAALCLSQPQFPWVGAVGVGGFVALLMAVLGVIALRPGLAPQPQQA